MVVWKKLDRMREREGGEGEKMKAAVIFYFLMYFHSFSFLRLYTFVLSFLLIREIETC